MFKKRRYIPRKPPVNYHPRFEQYAREKREWVDANPQATPEQYQKAMRQIADRCGI